MSRFKVGRFGPIAAGAATQHPAAVTGGWSLLQPTATDRPNLEQMGPGRPEVGTRAF